MIRKAILPDAYTEVILEAAVILNKGGLNSVLPYIKEAITLNMDAPEPHNLLGIFYEMTGDDNMARKHYRAAYALDPTYKPACRNLERLVNFEWGPIRRQYDYGVDLSEVYNKKQPQSAITDFTREGLGTV